MDNKELIAALLAPQKDGNHIFGPSPLCVTAAQVIAAQDARIAEQDRLLQQAMNDVALNPPA